jgi:hypothetical protein
MSSNDKLERMARLAKLAQMSEDMRSDMTDLVKAAQVTTAQAEAAAHDPNSYKPKRSEESQK